MYIDKYLLQAYSQFKCSFYVSVCVYLRRQSVDNISQREQDAVLTSKMSEKKGRAKFGDEQAGIGNA